MAMLISRATGNFTSSATWGVADSATDSQLTNPSATTNSTTAYVYSSAFTGTNTKVADGVVLFVKRLNTTGTFSVSFSQDNGTTATREVTVNASDLPENESWVFFKFGSTLTLDGGSDYKVGIKGSSSGNVQVGRNATAGNWARLISTTDTAAPTTGDTALIVGELTGAGTSNSYTVTMDNTSSTDFGTGVVTGGTPTQTNARTYNGIQIGQKGTLTWATSSATNYYLKLSGGLHVWSDGTYNMGTVSVPCPRDSTMYLQFDCAADNDFGFVAMNGSTVEIQGLSRSSGKNIWYCKLNSDAAVNATTLNVDTDTGWLDNDVIAVSSTTRTPTQCESGSLNGAAGASSLTVDGFAGSGGGIAFAHNGVSPINAEVILLTRNVRISGASATVTSYFQIIGTAIVSVNIDWVEFFWATTSCSGLASSSIINIQYCSFRDIESRAFFQSGSSTGTIIFSNNAIYNVGSDGIRTQSASTSGTFTVTNNIIMLSQTGLYGLFCGTAGTFSDNIICGARGDGIGTSGSTSSLILSNNIIHSCASAGFIVSSLGVPIVMDKFTVWRNSSSGLIFGTTTSTEVGSYATISNSVFFGNGNYNIGNRSAIIILDKVTSSGDNTYDTTNGYRSLMGISIADIKDSTFGVSSGIYTSHTGDISQGASGYTTIITMANTTLASATEVSSPNLMAEKSYIKSSKHDQTEGAFKSWFNSGVIERDSTIYNSAAPSERLTPTSASIKLQSGSRYVAVDDLGTVTINVFVRKSSSGDGASYNGNQPRLIVKQNLACGIANDTVLDTMTSSEGSWEQLSGTTTAVNADGVLEFIVDCGGTVGWVNVDDWSVS